MHYTADGGLLYHSCIHCPPIILFLLIRPLPYSYTPALQSIFYIWQPIYSLCALYYSVFYTPDICSAPGTTLQYVDLKYSFTVWPMQCISPQSVYRKVYSVDFRLQSVYFIYCTKAQCNKYSVKCSMFSVQYTMYSIMYYVQ